MTGPRDDAPVPAQGGGTVWCPECAGYGTVRVWVDGYEYARRSCPACSSAETVQDERRCTDCGRSLTASHEEQTSGLCLRCLNGPLPAVPAAGAVDEAGLRDRLLDWLLTLTGRWGNPSDRDVQWLTNEADELLRGPLAPLLWELAEMRAKVQALADEMWAEGIDWFNGDGLNPGEAAGALHDYADRLRAAPAATHTTSEEGQ